jgi:pimeloyl-ACP methyl ester carboxylesterase
MGRYEKPRWDMLATLAVVMQLGFAPFIDIPLEFWGVAPSVSMKQLPALERKRDRAVVLIHGLRAQVFSPERAEYPDPHTFQKPRSELVRALQPDFDVFGVSYAQVGPVDWVAASPQLREGIKALRFAGYKEIVLIGHSAGGIIARRFVEMNPNSGVTKVVAVASPYLGSGWAKLPPQLMPKSQLVFIRSLLPEVREESARTSTAKLPEDFQFCCVVCKLPRLDSDTTVGVDSQWPRDLQKLGIPISLVNCNHFDAMKCEKGVQAIVELAKGKVIRWGPTEVEKAQRIIFGGVPR